MRIINKQVAYRDVESDEDRWIVADGRTFVPSDLAIFPLPEK